MRRYRPLKFINIMYSIFIPGIILTMYIVYKDIKNIWAIRFVIGYVVFMMLFLVYLVGSIIFKLKNLKWKEIKGRLIKVFFICISMWAINILSMYLIKGEIMILHNLEIPMAMAFGITFWDLVGAPQR
ncbi:hypothetical protein [Clostridium algidicarnis]|nr:hypothetical protein [Clostridium algidicarnis]MBU3219553.1 hypothetical protein [Clostridium algidicarnis]